MNSEFRKKPPRKLLANSAGLLFLLPALLVFGLFQWYPIVFNLSLGFQSYTPGFEPEWVGFANYVAVLSDYQLPQALWNTAIFVIFGLLIGYLLPVIAAIIISEIRKGRGFFRLAIYLPKIIPGIALYIIWRWIFDPEMGLANQVIGLFGLSPQGWLLDQNMVMFSLVLMSTWANFGGTAILYMATLSSVSAELYEAAELDGANAFQRIRYITLPALSSTMRLLLIIQLIGTIQVLQEPFVMTGGGPAGASLTIMYLVYNHAFVSAEFGKSGALGSLVFMVLVVLAFFYMKKNDLAQAKGL